MRQPPARTVMLVELGAGPETASTTRSCLVTNSAAAPANSQARPRRNSPTPSKVSSTGAMGPSPVTAADRRPHPRCAGPRKKRAAMVAVGMRSQARNPSSLEPIPQRAQARSERRSNRRQTANATPSTLTWSTRRRVVGDVVKQAGTVGIEVVTPTIRAVDRPPLPPSPRRRPSRNPARAGHRRGRPAADRDGPPGSTWLIDTRIRPGRGCRRGARRGILFVADLLAVGTGC